MFAVNTQILLMLLGHINSADQPFLRKVSKSSLYLSGISNHLAASSAKSRLLGMVFGSAVSDFVDEPSKKLAFTAEDTDSAEWQWYKSLPNNKVPIGHIPDLKFRQKKSKVVQSQQDDRKAHDDTKAKRTPRQEQSSRILSIEEVTDESESEDDLPVYQKPDSDPEDDDDDPELVQRNKPTAPV